MKKTVLVSIIVALLSSSAFAQYLPTAGGTMTGQLVMDSSSVSFSSSQGGMIDFTGNLTVNWPLNFINNGAYFRTGVGTITNTTAAGTINGTFAVNSYLEATLASTNNVTYKNAATLYVAGAPQLVPMGNLAITFPYSIFSANGNVGVQQGSLIVYGD